MRIDLCHSGKYHSLVPFGKVGVKTRNKERCTDKKLIVLQNSSLLKNVKLFEEQGVPENKVRHYLCSLMH